MAFRLIPREERFFDDFVALAEQIQKGAALLEEMLAPDRPIWDKADEIKEVEHKCDFITHEIIQRLHRTFVTPLDREDIHTLARTLDDVMDAIDASAAIVRLYQIDRVRPDARELARLVATSCAQVVIAMKALERRHGVAEPAVEINRLENEADRAHQNAVRRLFEEEQNPIVDHQVEGDPRLPRGRHRSLRGRRQRARRRRRQARLTPRMDANLLAVVALIVVALVFDYINGFHDAANSIATVVSTRVLTPGKAVVWAAFFNFVAAFTFGTAVAKTVGVGPGRHLDRHASR